MNETERDSNVTRQLTPPSHGRRLNEPRNSYSWQAAVGWRRKNSSLAIIAYRIGNGPTLYTLMGAKRAAARTAFTCAREVDTVGAYP